MSNSKGIWVIGDVHGEYDKLISLINKLPIDAKICFVGDLIDRGKHSAKVLELIVNNENYFSVKGNHEQLMIDSFLEKDYSIWKQNGGNKTIKSFYREKYSLYRHFKFIRELPLFLYFEFENHKPLVISHSCIHNIWKGKDYNYSDADIGEVLWTHILDTETLKKDNEIFNIFGHTIVKNVKITETFAMIDTGAFNINGVLSAIHYPSKKLVFC